MAGFSMIHTAGGDEEDSPEKAKQLQSHIQAMMGPGHVDQMIRSGVSQCWLMLPPERKTADDLAAEVRRIVERALRDFQEDAKAFGMNMP